MTHRLFSKRSLGQCAGLGMMLVLPMASCGDDSGPVASPYGGTGGETGEDAAVDVAEVGTAGHGGTDGSDDCASIEELTQKVYVCFVIYNEEDDAGGVPGSRTDIPDYNGDKAVFLHFANSMYRYAQMLASFGVKLSFQPDWTFTEGVDLYRRSFFDDLLALGNVEIVPHAQETFVPYDELFKRLESLEAEPKMILGSMTFDRYLQKQGWFDENPGWSFWNAPTVSPPFVYRIASPKDVSVESDLRVHRAGSEILVSPGLPTDPSLMMAVKPAGRLVTPAYITHATREFLANPEDTSIPSQWRKRTDGSLPPLGENLTAQELTDRIRDRIEKELLPFEGEEKVEFATVSEILALYTKYESCIDLQDGQDLNDYLP